ncbi:MAG: phage major capsid protein, partial [Elusimicrobia bacterium]|nr:phage major capsid protein [Elusimicrobiota bacterium]
KSLEAKCQDFITREKAERIIEDVLNRIHPPERKALIPSSSEEVLDAAREFAKNGRNTPEKAWTSEYGKKFGGMRNFLRAARDKSSLLFEGKAMVEGTGSAGGYLVPTDFHNEVVRLLRDNSVIMKIANVVPMSSWKRSIPVQATHVSVTWPAEGAARSVTNPTFGQITQQAKVMAAVIKCTDELIRDSAINLTQFLSEIVAEAMALEIERVAIMGNTGSGDPFTGVRYASGVNVTSMESTSVSFDDVANLLFSLSEAYSQNAVMVLNRLGLKKIIKLKDEQGNYLWQPPAGNVPATIWGVPYEISGQIPSNLGTGTDETLAIVGRFGQYLWISPRQEMEVKISQDASSNDPSFESAFMQDQTWLRFVNAMSIDVMNGGAFGYLQFK